jgi:acyl carrier protein
MDELREKLANCFLLVFPNLDRNKISSASVDTVREWDSIAQVNLLSIIGEEFGMEIDFEEFEGATSFEGFAQRLHQIRASA